MQGPVIIEVAEMGRLDKASWDEVKDFMTTYCDAERLKYRKDNKAYVRRMILVGTTNYDEFLPHDPSGTVNDKFVPIYLEHGFPIEPYMEANREQLWAEAYQMYKDGERANMPRDMYKQMQVAVKRATKGADPNIMEALAEFVKAYQRILMMEGVKFGQIKEFVKAQDGVDKLTYGMLKGAMADDGFYLDRSNGKRWKRRPDNTYEGGQDEDYLDEEGKDRIIQ